MPATTVTLTIVGSPEAEVEVVPRDRGDEPPPPVYEGRLGRDGRLTISLPPGYFVVLSPECKTAIANFLDGPSNLTVDLVPSTA